MPAPNFTYMFAICGPRTCHAAMLSSCLYHCIPHGYQFQVLAADAPGKDVAHGPRAWVRVTHVGDSTKPLAPAWPSPAAEAPGEQTRRWADLSASSPFCKSVFQINE